MQQKYKMCDYYCTQQLQAAVTNAQMQYFFCIFIISRTFVEFIFLYNLCTQILLLCDKIIDFLWGCLSRVEFVDLKHKIEVNWKVSSKLKTKKQNEKLDSAPSTTRQWTFYLSYLILTQRVTEA